MIKEIYENKSDIAILFLLSILSASLFSNIQSFFFVDALADDLSAAKPVTKKGNQKAPPPTLFKDVLVNETIKGNYYYNSSSFQTKADAKQIYLNGTVETSTGKPAYFTLLDITKCNSNNNVNNGNNSLSSCLSLQAKKLLPSNRSTIQQSLMPGKIYQFTIEDESRSSANITVKFVLSYERDFTDYVNYTKYGIRLSYPYDWTTIEEDDDSIKFLSPRQNGSDVFQENVLVTVKNRSLMSANKVDQSRQTCHRLLNESIYIDGNNAQVTACTFLDAKYGQFKSKQFLFENKNKIYNITYTALAQEYSKPAYLQALKEIVTTFRLLSVDQNKFNKIGIETKYPSDWKHEEGSTILSFSPSSNDTAAINIVKLFNIEGLSLNEQVGRTIGLLRQNTNLTGFNVVNYSIYNLNGILVYKVLYEYKILASSMPVKVLAIYALKNNQIYTFLYLAKEPVEFNRYLPVVQEMIKSFKIQVLAFSDGKQANPSYDVSGIRVANSPRGINFNPNTNMLYVANFGSGLLSVIDTKTNNVITNISSVGIKPYDIGVIPYDNLIYVSDVSSNNVFILDGITNKVISSQPIQVSNSPAYIAVDPDPNDRLVFVANREGGSISVISGEVLKKVNITLAPTVPRQVWEHKKDTVINVGGKPWGLDLNPITNRLYVANGNDSTLSVIDYAKTSTTDLTVYDNHVVGVGPFPSGVKVDSNTNRVYVGTNKTIYVVDGFTNTVINRIDVPTRPDLMDIDQNKRKLFVASSDYNKVYVIDADTGSIEKNITIDGRPAYVFFNEKNNVVYVSGDRSNRLYLISNDNQYNFLVAVRFKVSPPDAGGASMICDKKDYSNNEKFSDNAYGLYPINTILACHAEMNQGFKFVSWGNTDYSSSNTSNKDPQNIAVNLTRFGIVNLNIEKESQLKEFWEQNKEWLIAILTAVIAAPIVAWVLSFIPASIDKERQLTYLRKFIASIDNIYGQNYKDKDNCLKLLEKQRKEAIGLLQSGRINDSTFRIINVLISGYIYEITK